MAKKKQVGRRVEGWKAKNWYQVFAPENLGKTYIGDTIANDPENVVGRVMQTTLGEIINDYCKAECQDEVPDRECCGRRGLHGVHRA